MKTNLVYLFLLTIVILLLDSCTLLKEPTQNLNSKKGTYIYVYLKPDIPLELKSDNQTNNERLNEVISRNNVNRFHLSWPNAKTKSLQNIYEMHFKDFKGNTDQLIKDVESLDIFEKTEVANYYFAEGAIMDIQNDPKSLNAMTWGCANPVQVNDARIVNNWSNNDAMELLDANCAWTITKGDPSIVVGIADTEFNVNHEDLKNQIIYTSANVPAPNCIHGSLVAGCVAAETNNGVGITGIGYKTKMAGYQVPTSSSCLGNPWPHIWQAYLDGRKVINVSWSGVGSVSGPGNLITGIQEMIDCGTTLVVAAGNSPNAQHHSNYANIPGVINVSGVTKDNLHGPTGHAHNQWVDVCAMSVNVTTTGTPADPYPGGWGTSFAAPQVAGVAALILSINPCLSPADIETIIKSTTDPIADANLFPNGLGTGRANAYKALQMATTYGVYQPITTNTVWNTERFVSGDLVIEPGYSLTITDKVRFSKDSKLIVKQGAYLSVNGGTLTNSSGCKNDFWSGIEVWGIENNSSASVQGRVVLSGATIENAANGIVNFKSFTPNTNGGIIYASNSTFKNNGRAIAIHPYATSFPRRGVFNNCKFIIDDDYITTNAPLGVTLWEVDRYVFRGCEFKDDRTNPTNLGRAIYSADAGYEIYPLGNNRSTFSGFNVAIQSNNTGSNYSVVIENADFESNNTSIWLEGVDGARLVENNIQVGKTGFSSDIGMRLQSSKFFTIENNNFSKGINSDNFTVGLFIRNAGDFYNQVYKNNYNNLFVGNWAQGQNNNIYPSNPTFNCFDGLEYQCNLNGNNQYDFVITGNNSNEGIRRTQGNQNLAAGNQFSTTNNNRHFINFGSCNINYFHNNHTPTNNLGTVNLISVNASNSCNQSILVGQNLISANNLKLNFERLNKMIRKEGMFTSKGTDPIDKISNDLFSLQNETSKKLRSTWIAYQQDTTLTYMEKDKLFSALLNSVGKPDLALYGALGKMEIKKALNQIKKLQKDDSLTELQRKELNRFNKLYNILLKAGYRNNPTDANNKILIKELKSFLSKNPSLADLKAKQILDKYGVKVENPFEKKVMIELRKIKEQAENN